MELIIEIVTATFFTIIGLCIGSFLNVVIYRLPEGKSIVKPASHCPKCKYQLKWYDNIPLLSYLILGGKCRKCKTVISWQYPLVELITGLGFLASYLRFGLTLTTAIVAVAMVFYIILAAIDYKYMIIPDTCIVALIILAIIGFIWKLEGFEVSVADRLWSMAMVVVIFMITTILSRLLHKSLVGFGDYKLLFATGLLIGSTNVILGIFLGAFIAMIIELLILGKRRAVVAFGPYLVMGFVICIFFGQEIINWYLSLLGV